MPRAREGPPVSRQAQHFGHVSAGFRGSKGSGSLISWSGTALWIWQAPDFVAALDRDWTSQMRPSRALVRPFDPGPPGQQLQRLALAAQELGDELILARFSPLAGEAAGFFSQAADMV